MYIYMYIYICIYIHFNLVCCSNVRFIILCQNVSSPMLFMIKFLTCLIDPFLIFDL